MSRKLMSPILCVALVALVIPLATAGTSGASSVIYGADNPNPPTNTTKLVFIHHSCGENWLNDFHGGLGGMLQIANYFVSDTNYGWGPDSIGDNTDIGHWWSWFRGPDSATYTAALYNESGQNCDYSRPASDPGGENKVIMFKSCYPNSNLAGNPGDPVPDINSNPLRGQAWDSGHLTVANAKGIYIDLLEYFKTRTDKLFIAVTAPPVQDATYASNARAFNNWLVNDWLDGYPHNNVFVFDFYNVLTSNGGNAYVNDAGAETGNHHRWYNDAIQHKTDGGGNTAAYADGDDHPTPEGNQKGTAEFAALLNVAYNRFSGESPGPPPPPPPGPSTRQCAHDSIGVTAADYTWYLAEGCTSGGFETWVLVQNPGADTASVDLTFMTDEGEMAGPHLEIDGGSRETVNVSDTVQTYNVSTKVDSTEPVVAERAMYYNNRTCAHDSVGVTAPNDTWYLAEGCTDGGFETWVLVQNPGADTASVDLTFMTDEGEVAGPHLEIDGGSR
ncbi:MAG: hypothetical protein KKE90_02175, partial [Actinobacteria bacterium]|nr:hypothetical protein [Actinomycetota bacterium]